VQASTSDPDAQFMRTSDHGVAPCLNVQLAVDGAHGFIVDVEVVKQPSDSAQLAPSMDRLRERFGEYPQQAIADGDYTNHEAVLGMAERGIDFYGSWTGRTESGISGRGSRDRRREYDAREFGYDERRNEMICPEGKRLRYRLVQHPHPGADLYPYVAKGEDCRSCAAREACCPNTRIGKHGRSASIAVRAPDIDGFDRKMQTRAAKQIYRQRSRLAEFPNLWIKEKLRFRRFSGRGRLKARAEAILNAVTFNVQRLFRIQPALAV
jgi:hypothetical protein